MSMDIKGMKQIQSRIESMGKNGVRVENKAIRAGGVPVAEAMREEVAVSDVNSSGYVHIRDDIQISGVKNLDGIKSVEVGPGKKTAWRANFLVNGTIKMPPDDFMGRAYDQSKDEAQEKIKDVIRSELKL
ncbi:HK97 gp10 family phage protein [Halobacillus shinanisalinarum]|uniref:HK97 gp10 family phage protein n=1 Tax=Halobacillus shinanisalinarum TaxID=2932258 RepID=A0ABY4GZ80_9BACI|nr:HK97-gp10 family putative phage morphogenesis protein [Halobacillus shinanisalinarum]UOQ93413.1 HK97 gp10 family phage protein [Halobacillus shinanisalinarum]